LLGSQSATRMCPACDRIHFGRCESRVSLESVSQELILNEHTVAGVAGQRGRGNVVEPLDGSMCHFRALVYALRRVSVFERCGTLFVQILCFQYSREPSAAWRLLTLATTPDARPTPTRITSLGSTLCQHLTRCLKLARYVMRCIVSSLVSLSTSDASSCLQST